MSTIIILHSSVSVDNGQNINTRRMESLFGAKHYDFKKIDGADQENKEQRDKLFGLSGQRGKYPQCFVESTDGAIRFVGLWEAVSHENCEHFSLQFNYIVIAFGNLG